MSPVDDPGRLAAEQRARVLIDQQLVAAGWLVQEKRDLNLFAGRGIAVREVVMKPGHGRVDYLLYVDKAVVGVIEAKPQGTPLSGVEWQSAMYAEGLPADVRLKALTKDGRLPFVFEASGSETHFTNGFDPEPRARAILNFPKPETLARTTKLDKKKVHSFDHRLEWYDDVDEGEVWCVQVWERVQIPVRALEACVFADNGAAVTAKGQNAPIGLTPGWAKRFADMQDWTVQQLDTYGRLVDGQTTDDVKKIITQHLCGTTDQVVDINAEIDPTGGKIAFGLRRIGRASNDDARLILANAGNYTARPDRDGNLFPDEDEDDVAQD